MNKFLYAASAMVLALGSPALAGGQHGGGHGGGQGGGKAAHQGGQGHGGQGGGQAMKSNRGNGGQGQAMKVDRGNGGGQAMKAERGQGSFAKADRGNGHDRVKIGNGNNGRGGAVEAKIDRGNVRVATLGARARSLDYSSAAWGACPPGLAAKNNGCLPPGQAKKLVGAAVPAMYASAMLEGPYRDWYRDDDRYLYRMGDGYIYQVDRGSNLVSALFPYGFRDYTYYPVGMTYPSDYSYYNVPYQYRSYYPDGSDYLYRYGNGAIYGLDPQTQAVRSIVALLAGDLAVGQRLPASYGVYNVPLSYRQQYYDTPDNWYRYNDGYIYRVDPTTQLITAVINALV
jgi:hypothetical protein